MSNDLEKLAALIRRERERLLFRWRQQVRELPSAQHLDVPTLNDHLPQLIEALAAALQESSDETIPHAMREASPPAHGLQRVHDGFDIEEVVGEYNLLRGCIHDLAQAGRRCLCSFAGSGSHALRALAYRKCRGDNRRLPFMAGCGAALCTHG